MVPRSFSGAQPDLIPLSFPFLPQHLARSHERASLPTGSWPIGAACNQHIVSKRISDICLFPMFLLPHEHHHAKPNADIGPPLHTALPETSTLQSGECKCTAFSTNMYKSQARKKTKTKQRRTKRRAVADGPNIPQRHRNPRCPVFRQPFPVTKHNAGGIQVGESRVERTEKRMTAQ